MHPLESSHLPAFTLPDLGTYFVDGGINLVGGIVVLIVGAWLSKRASIWARRALDRVHNFDETLKPLVGSVVRYVILIAAIIAVLERFGVETTSLITILGAAGLAIGLALQGTLSNVASGVMLLILRPFKVGDWITIVSPNQSGSVREVGLFTTILISADQAYVSLPNSVVFGSAIINSSREALSRINFGICADASSDVERALKIISDVLGADERILKVPPAQTGVLSLKEYSIELLVRCWVHNADDEDVKFSLQRVISRRFLEAGIAIPARRQISRAEAANADAAARQKTAIGGRS